MYVLASWPRSALTLPALLWSLRIFQKGASNHSLAVLLFPTGKEEKNPKTSDDRKGINFYIYEPQCIMVFKSQKRRPHLLYPKGELTLAQLLGHKIVYINPLISLLVKSQPDPQNVQRSRCYFSRGLRAPVSQEPASVTLWPQLRRDDHLRCTELCPPSAEMEHSP